MAGSSDYKIGSMNIAEQSRTFDSFIKWAVWGGLITALGILGFVLHFGGGFAGLTSALISCITGVVLGAVLKMPKSWYFTLGGAFVLMAIIAAIAAFISMF